MSANNVNEFVAKMQMRGDQVQKAADLAVRKLALLIAREVVYQTPVDTGRARSNWFAGINTPVTATRAAFAPGKAGSTAGNNAQGALDQIDQVIASRRSGSPIYLSNNLPYIASLNEGSSAQAPAGFVEAAIKRAESALGNLKVFT